MKQIARFLLVAMCVVPFGADSAPVPTTRGNNLTAYNGASGSTNNNTWNALLNVRSGADTAEMPVADFGNCNALILRCAQPKCANGGCIDVDVTATIVSGCVRSNEVCAQYGDELVQYISAQLIAQSTAKANAASNAAASAAAQQSAQQIQSMQMQMEQMQSQMAAQNAETVAQLQSALEEQKQLTAQAIAEATAARETTPVNNYVVADAGETVVAPAVESNVAGLSTAQQIAAQNGVSADILAREQVTGQIMSSIENAETQLKALKTTMTDTFDYAGCDSKGNNCTGPKRVKIFKQKAMEFFEPYENVLDELYDALITAQAVGVDITDIYMMLNDSCNVWGKYMCEEDQPLRYTTSNCRYDNGSHQYKSVSWGDDKKFIIGGANCTVGKIIPVSDGGCQPLGLLQETEEVRYNWLYPEEGEESRIRVGCMSDMLETSNLFRNRKKGASIDIATLERIIEQDAPSVYGARFGNSSSKTAPNPDGIKFCAVSEKSFADLEKIVALKKLPDKVCVTEKELGHELENEGVVSKGDSGKKLEDMMAAFKQQVFDNEEEACAKTGGKWMNVFCSCQGDTVWNSYRGCVSFDEIEKAESRKKCLEISGATWDEKEGLCMSLASNAVDSAKGSTSTGGINTREAQQFMQQAQQFNNTLKSYSTLPTKQ